MSPQISALERARAAYEPRLPAALRAGVGAVGLEERPGAAAVEADAAALRAQFPRSYGRPLLGCVPGEGPQPRRPLIVGAVLSGGQAPGGHNVLAGLLDGLRSAHPASRLHGFLGGPRGIVARRSRELTAETIAPYRNTGGFDLIGSGRDKLETTEQLEACRATCAALALDGLVVVGGDDSNTNAAVLAEDFLVHGLRTAIVGVPKTIDGDLKGDQIEASFGFDTATKVYAELIGNIARDARSAGKYWHFIKLMGRSASHVTLECALRTHPNVALIGEEARERGHTLEQIAAHGAEIVRRRAQAGRNYGVLLVPEGLIEFVPEMRALIDELNRELASGALASEAALAARLPAGCRRTFEQLPARIREQLLLDRDAHGNVQVSLIATEQLLIELVRAGLGPSADFRVQGHFFGYEGRCAAPSDFDADYTYSLGQLAAVLVAFGRTGYLCAIRRLADPPERWMPRAVPLTSLMQLEPRKGRPTPVIRKALVRLDAEPFLTFARERERWALEDDYVYPGPIQYFGPAEVREATTETLRLETART